MASQMHWSRPLRISERKESPEGLIRPRILWLTNIPVPYRIGTWNQLSRDVDLSVAFMARTEPNRDWDLSSQLAGITHTYVDAPVVRLGPALLYLPTPRLLALLRSQPFDAIVVDGWESPAYMAAAWFARRRGWRLVVLSRSILKSRRFQGGPVAAARRRFMLSADAVITGGRDSTEATLSLGVDPSRIIESLNAVDSEWFRTTTEEMRRDELADAGLGRHFLFVGRLIALKNVSSLIEAFGLMHEPEDQLSIVGSGPLRAQLEKQVRDIGISESVAFLGSLEGLPLAHSYAAAHVLVLPSTNEIWGLVVNEALASGLQVVVSEACGISAELHEVEGVSVVAPDAKAIAAAMRESTCKRIPSESRAGLPDFKPSLGKAVQDALRE